MGRIFNLFAKRLELQQEADAAVDRPAARNELLSAFSGTEAAIFETIGETQQSIDGSLASVIGNLNSLQSLTDHLGKVRAEVAGALEDHRKVALAGLSLEHDRDRFNQLLGEKTREAEGLAADAARLRAQLEESRTSHSKAKAELEVLEQRHHLLAVAKKEADEQAGRQASALLNSQDEAEALRLEVNALREQTKADDARIIDLAQGNQEKSTQISLLTSRCENYENIVQLRGDEIVTLNEQVSQLHRANDVQLQENQQRERETAALRSDLSKAFERHQAEIRTRDSELNALRSEHDLTQSSMRVIDQLNADLKVEQDKQLAEIRRLQDSNKQFEIAAARAEAKATRVSASLEAGQAAKAQVEQSRAAMAARVESMSQDIRSGEADTRRLESEVARLTGLLDQQGAQSRDTIEALNAKISTLEKDLATQSKETIFYMAQLEQAKKSDGRL